jgi:hypothetical protein
VLGPVGSARVAAGLALVAATLSLALFPLPWALLPSAALVFPAAALLEFLRRRVIAWRVPYAMGFVVTIYLTLTLQAVAR